MYLYIFSPLYLYLVYEFMMVIMCIWNTITSDKFVSNQDIVHKWRAKLTSVGNGNLTLNLSVDVFL